MDQISTAASSILANYGMKFLLAVITYFFGHDLIDPTFIGKTSVFLLYTAIAFKLLNINYFGNWLFYIIIPINIFSAVDYFLKAYRKVFNKNI